MLAHSSLHDHQHTCRNAVKGDDDENYTIMFHLPWWNDCSDIPCNAAPAGGGVIILHSYVIASFHPPIIAIRRHIIVLGYYS